jgi:iron complex outermembrane recepter protein
MKDTKRGGATLRMNAKVAATVGAILGTHVTAALADGPATDQTSATGTGGLAEVIVTAQRRAENIQDVPITIQALTSETLSQLNVQTFDEFVKYLPNVTQYSTGPSQGVIFMRGISVGPSGGGGAQGGGTTDAFPAVAIYLDEQSAQLPSRNLDIYAADLERIEVLEGPQGTLFGGGAESGVLRYITNKPKLDVTEGSASASYGTTAHGDPNTAVNAVLNLPLIDEQLAVRGVIYNDHQGGYINNLPSTFTRSGTDEGFTRYNGGVVPANSPSINNANVVGNAINPVTYTGTRLELLWKLNDKWDALLSQSYQNMNSQGVFYQMPFSSEGVVFNSVGEPIGSQALPPLSVTLFNPSYDNDRFENTALVVNGEVGDLKLVYSGAYLVRNVEQVQDYTNYARGVFGYYYQCAGYSTSPATGQCYSPSTIWRESERNTHQSHELRLSTPDDWRVRALVGGYWEKFNILDQTQWTYVTVPTCSPSGLDVNCFLPIKPWPGSPAFTPVPDTGFFDDVERGYKQLAEFASLDIDIIPKVLTITGGIRHFTYDNTESGGDVGSTDCKQFTPTTYFGFCQQPYGTNFALRQTEVSNSGNRARGNISWHVMPDFLLYYTWSQGFRAGQFNRTTSCHLPDASGIDQYCIPAITVPDNVTNNEVGWKTEWFNHRLQFNGTAYQEYWDNAQTSFFDPQAGLGNLVFATNGPSYRVRGVELSFVGRVTQGLTLQASSSWNSSSQTNSPYLVANNPALLANPATAAEYGKPITSIPNVYGFVGSPTAYSPPFNMNGRARYDWVLGDYGLFVQAGAAHQGHEVTATGHVPAYNIPPFTTYDAAAGISKGQWSVQLYGQNLTNVNTPLSMDSAQFVLIEVPPRPRVLGIKVDYEFSQGK